MEAIKEKIQVALEKTKIRLAELDWSKEFINMINDSDYTCLQYYHPAINVVTIGKFDPEGLYEETKRKWRAMDRNAPEAKVMEEDWRSVSKMLNDLRNTEMTALREKWDAEEDDCLKPYLKCEDCDHFGYSETDKTEHECDLEDEDRTSKCKVCKKSCGTYERLEKHMKSKHHTKYRCKECEFGTSSKAQYDRHIKSKEHKETCGIEKPEFKCETCDRVFPFKSLYEAHMISPTHLKKIQQKM
jgi:hypothetical protein